MAKPLLAVTLGDLQAFGQRTGYLPLNVGAALKLPPKKDRLAERILSETQVHRILALEPNRRNQALLRLLYAGGLRVSELATHLVQATLGHASVATTGRYLHARPTDSSARYLAV